MKELVQYQVTKHHGFCSRCGRAIPAGSVVKLVEGKVQATHKCLSLVEVK